MLCGTGTSETLTPEAAHEKLCAMYGWAPPTLHAGPGTIAEGTVLNLSRLIASGPGVNVWKVKLGPQNKVRNQQHVAGSQVC